MTKTSSGIYLHIPFCTIKCFYCDYYSTVDYDEDRLPLFFNSLSKEIESYKDIAGNFTFDTIFIGGGTPSIINPKYIENIFNALSINFDLSHATEITLEINPGEAALENLKTFRNRSDECVKIFDKNWDKKQNERQEEALIYLNNSSLKHTFLEIWSIMFFLFIILFVKITS